MAISGSHAADRGRGDFRGRVGHKPLVSMALGQGEAAGMTSAGLKIPVFSLVMECLPRGKR